MVSPSSLGDDSVDLLGSIRWQPDLINAAPQKLKGEGISSSDQQGKGMIAP
jgi:hypothetical protein